MAENIFVRFFHPDAGIRWGVQLGEQVHDVSEQILSLEAWLQTSTGRVADAIAGLEAAARRSRQTYPAGLFDNAPVPDKPHWLAPVDHQEIWAAGVTYERSRQARQEEAVDGGDVYARVYSAERPELFFKAQGRNVVGPHGEVGIRHDATWSVPEPELALVINSRLEVVGFTIGNDMSSRDIEGANPLYLPQAKVYTASCALGPGILLRAGNEWLPAGIRLNIQRGGQTAFEGEVHTARIKRKIAELTNHLGRCYDFPHGVILLTGTGIVPPNDFTLAAKDAVTISIEGIGSLVNTVKVV
jgi:2-dehydro-3-deoxy-D-arabinonate dehydratase